MIGIGLDARTLLTIGVLASLAGVSALLQEQQYRERQVLNPQTDEWVEEQPAAPAQPGDDLGQARAWLAEGKPGKARKLLSRWLKRNPDDERYYEAVFLLGECYFNQRDFWKALERYNEVAENTSGELFQLANQRCVDVARAFLSGQKRIVWRILRLPAYDEGIDILDRVWERIPGSRLGELALKLKADFHFNRGDLDLAQDEYANLAQQYPSGRYTQLAMLRTAEAAQAAFAGIRFDDGPLVEADERYRQMQATFPAYAQRERVGERLEGIRQQRAAKDLDIADWYRRTGQTGAAEYYYRLVLQDWPDTLAAAEAQIRLRALGVRLDEPQGASEE